MQNKKKIQSIICQSKKKIILNNFLVSVKRVNQFQHYNYN